MRLYLAQTSALTLWRAGVTPPSPPGKSSIPEDFTPVLRKREAAWLVDYYGINFPVVSAVASPDLRRPGQRLQCCVHNQLQPKREYLHLGRETYCASPELTLAQIAGKIAGTQLITPALSATSIERHARVIILTSLVTEFCGSYVIDPLNRDGYLPRAPLTSRALIHDFLENSGRFPGRSALEQAAALAFDNSHSPAETNLVLLECLGFNMGGMSFAARPQLNALTLTHRASRAHNRFPDQLFGDGIGEVVEYNGGRHEGERADDDDQRRIELQREGLNVTVVSSRALSNAENLDWTLRDVREKVGTVGRCPSDYKKRRSDLRALLFELSGTHCRENKGLLLPEALIPPRTLRRIGFAEKRV